VAFKSLATNLVPGDTNSQFDIFVHDLVSGSTTRCSVDSAGQQGNSVSLQPSLSSDGGYVAFRSQASNLVPGDTNGLADLFVRDVLAGTTTRVNVGPGGVQADGTSDYPVITKDGRDVAYRSNATNLVAGDTNGVADVFATGPYLNLDATPNSVGAGAKLTFDVQTGQPAGPVLLYAVEINGSPVILPVTKGAFDAAGLWSLTATVPPGLQGLVVDFLAFGLAADGSVALTNRETVTFL